MVSSWDRLESESCGHFAIFSVRRDRNRSPRSGCIHNFYVIEAPDWVNIVPVTPDGRLVCVRQYRHGAREVALELPGGLVDTGETAAEAALREMREETGYTSGQAIPIGTMIPNSAIHENRCHLFVAPGASPSAEQCLDSAEDIEVVLLDPDEIPRLIANGTINNGIMVAAFHYFALYRQSQMAPHSAPPAPFLP